MVQPGVFRSQATCTIIIYLGNISPTFWGPKSGASHDATRAASHVNSLESTIPKSDFEPEPKPKPKSEPEPESKPASEPKSKSFPPPSVSSLPFHPSPTLAITSHYEYPPTPTTAALPTNARTVPPATIELQPPVNTTPYPFTQEQQAHDIGYWLSLTPDDLRLALENINR
ncbi:hypothetical protein BGZ94_000174 [Podila epigama]|nr:hypothetical protein BGZ94_000174 [Podila epigama]